MGFLAGVWELVRGSFVALEQARKEVKQASGFATAKCHYITDKGVWELQGTFSKDRRYFTPRGINRLFRVKGVYPFNGTSMILYCYDQNVETLNLELKPKKLSKKVIENLKRREKDLQEDLKVLDPKNTEGRDLALDTVVMADYTIKGADTLSSFAQDIIDSTDIRFIAGPSKGRIILICIITLLLGWIMGAIMAGVVVLAMLSGGG